MIRLTAPETPDQFGDWLAQLDDARDWAERRQALLPALSDQAVGMGVSVAMIRMNQPGSPYRAADVLRETLRRVTEDQDGPYAAARAAESDLLAARAEHAAHASRASRRAVVAADDVHRTAAAAALRAAAADTTSAQVHLDALQVATTDVAGPPAEPKGSPTWH